MLPATTPHPQPERISTKLLAKHYTTVHSLESYLGATATAADSDAYTNLLATSFVCLPGNHTPPRFKYALPDVDMSTVINTAMVKLFEEHGKKCRNIIVQGYNLNLDGKQVRRVFANTNLTALQASEWELLHERIGTDAMIHLLTKTSVFVALPNECLCQLVGIPITAHRLDNLQLSASEPPARPVKRTSSTSSEDLRGPSKRAKLNNGKYARGHARSHIQEPSPSKILLSRNRLFYGRVMENGRTNGLPPSHILNKVKFKIPGDTGDGMDVDDQDEVDLPDPRKQMEAARRLSKYVFPRQYGLASPFRFESQSSMLPDFSNRDPHIAALGPCKTPKRLKDAVVMLEKVIWRHGKCRYWQLRNLACPSERLQKKASKNEVLALLAHRTSSAPRSQKEYHLDPSYDTEGDTISAMGLTQAEEHARRKPRLAEMACSHANVFRYAMLATTTVFPSSFWGSNANFLLVMKKVKTFISCRRYETLSLHHILQGFNTAACEWLMPPGTGARQTRVPVTDALKRRQLLEDFMFWYFDSFLIPLLKTTFYVTDSSALRNHVLYFRQDDWASLCSPLIDSLTSATYQQISRDEAAHILKNRSLGFSFVRLLPKDAGVRPIANLRRKQKGKDEKGRFVDRSINQVLQACFRILNYERDERRELVGASVFNMNDVYAKLKEFKKRLPGRLPKLYFVKVDVQACFDTIPQAKLIEILHHILSADKYVVQQFGKVTSEAGKVKRTFLMKATPGEEPTNFLDIALELAGALHSTIFADAVRHKNPEKAEILQLLEQHINDNIVKIGSEYYRQTIGIPQGSVVSSLLCAFFYGDLEKKFRPFTEDQHSMLIRQTDDYLFVSADERKARGFLAVMNQGHPEYGCFISQDKTVTNFDFDGTLQSSHNTSFPWCGLLLDTKHLTVSVEYARYSGTDLGNTLTIGRGSAPGAVFRYKMLQLAKNRCHIIYNDVKLNTERVVHCNVYENFLLCAMKMHVYLQGWGLDTRKHASFLWETIRQMVNYCYNSIRNKTATKLALEHGGRADVNKAVITWLGSHAFHVILSRQPTRYAAVIKRLEAYLSTPRGQRYSRRFRKLRTERLALFLGHFTS